MTPLAASSGLGTVTAILAQVAGLALAAAVLAGIAAFVYRWYVRESVPAGLALLIGLSAVALYLSTTTILNEVITGTDEATDVEVALFNIAAIAGASLGADAGRRAGDRVAENVFSTAGLGAVESEVGRLVQSVGRVITVELPDEIDDATGYDPVPAETKEKLAGKRFVFPRRLTVGELQTRLVSRLKTDYAVGHVDIELDADGTVGFLALGSRAAGIGPTLPPATNAVAIRADPAFAASAGDLVQVWETDPTRRVLTAELRGVADDVVTLAIDAGDTPKVDPSTRYRLVTLPVDDRPDREFASLLRAADETFSSVTVEAGSPLHGMPVGALRLVVVAVRDEGAEQTVLPDADHVLGAGSVVSAIGRPEELRRLERAAEPLPASVAPATEPETTVQTVPESGAGGSEPDDGVATEEAGSTPGGDVSNDVSDTGNPSADGVTGEGVTDEEVAGEGAMDDDLAVDDEASDGDSIEADDEATEPEARETRPADDSADRTDDGTDDPDQEFEWAGEDAERTDGDTEASSDASEESGRRDDLPE